MCVFGGSAPRDNSAEEARRREEERQARITQGRDAIDSAFEAFSPDYFSGYEQDYMGYYDPLLEDQASDARRRLTLELARTGNLTSSAGIRRLQELQEFEDQQRGQIASRAADAATDLRNQVEMARGDLYSQNTAAADPGSAAANAARRSESLMTPPTYSPLGDVFGNFFTNLSNFDRARDRRSIDQRSGTQLFLPSGGQGGSGRVVS